MSAALRRGACPSLSAPMPTGDGLLVRINPKGGGLSAGQLAGVADATARFGNGVLEITSRGSLQCRGLRSATVDPFTAEITALGIEADDAPEIRVPPLAGEDPAELDDPRPLAGSLRTQIGQRGIAARLAPKLSMVIDTGGAHTLAGLQADIRLEAVPPSGSGRWLVMTGGNATNASPLGIGTAGDILGTTMAILEHLAATGPAARARDIAPEKRASLARGLEPAKGMPSCPTLPAIGIFPLRDGSFACGFALPFSQIASADLAAFAASIGEDREIRLAPGGVLLVLGLTQLDCDLMTANAGNFGFVTSPDDLRLRLFACAGSPACASSHLRTKAMARDFVAQCPELLADLPKLHISGCPKQCAKPAGPHGSLIGTDTGVEIALAGLTLPSASRRRLADFAADTTRQGIPA